MPIAFNASETSYRDWVFQFEVKDAETGELIDFTGATIAISIYDDNQCPKISATSEDMIAIVSPGILTLTIPYAQTNLCAGTYNVGGYYQLNGETIDLLDGEIAVRDGWPRP
jgi:hypothetical protein